MRPVWLQQFGESRRRAPWLVLWLGFGGLLISIVAAGLGTLLSLDKVHQDETRIRKTFISRMGVLDQIRAHIYLSGTYVRDFLLSPDPSGAAAQSERLATIERESFAALDSYSRTVEADGRQPFQALKSEIEAYWRVLDRTMQWTPEERSMFRDSFFYDEMIPRRNAMLTVADRIAAANERSLAHAEEQMSAASDGLRRTLMITFGVTLLGGILLAILTIGHTLAPGAGTRTTLRMRTPGRVPTCRSFRPSCCGAGERAPHPGARAARRDRAVALGNPDGCGKRRVRGRCGGGPRASRPLCAVWPRKR